jgi:hypothetical protein
MPSLMGGFSMAATATWLMAGSCSGAYAASFTEMGAGEVSCEAWTTDHEQSDQQSRYKAVQEEQWVVGFLTGAAATKAGEAVTYDRGSDPLAGIDWDGVMKWISNYCASRPTNSIDSATENFVLFRKRSAP